MQGARFPRKLLLGGVVVDRSGMQAGQAAAPLQQVPFDLVGRHPVGVGGKQPQLFDQARQGLCQRWPPGSFIASLEIR